MEFCADCRINHVAGEHTYSFSSVLPPKKVTRPQIFVFGEIEGAEAKHFPGREKNPKLFATWKLSAATSSWDVIEGITQGSTTVSDNNPQTPQRLCIWNEPFSFHLGCSQVAQWPKIIISVFDLDSGSGKTDLVGYALADIPVEPGSYEMRLFAWRPCHEDGVERVRSYLCNSSLELLNVEGALCSDGVVDADRLDFAIESTTTVFVRMNVILRNFDQKGVTCVASTTREEEPWDVSGGGVIEGVSRLTHEHMQMKKQYLQGKRHGTSRSLSPTPISR